METTRFRSHFGMMRVLFLFVLCLGNSSVAFQAQAPIRRLYDALLATPRSIEKRFSRRGKDQQQYITRLSYRDGVEDTRKETSSSTTGSTSSSTWWRQKEESRPQQEFVDDYLEFLDKRYHRLYDDEVDRKFPAFKWLTHGSKVGQGTSQSDSDNALYALGVAGLASKELLQKHHMSVAKEELSKDVSDSIVDVDICTSELSQTSSRMTSKLRKKAGRLFRPITNTRRRLLNVQSSKARSVAFAIVKAAKSSPGALLRLSGGKTTVGFTLTALAALAVVAARPLANTIVREGASHA